MRMLRAIMILGLIISLAAITVLPASASDFGEFSRTEQVKVAILDSGSNIAYKEGFSLIDGTVKDYSGHGTLMAKIIKEVSPNAELYIIKVMRKDGQAVNEEVIILGLEWAIFRDVDVINISLGLKDSARLHWVIKKAYDKGIIIVAAAGNTEAIYPAKYKEVIAVGALDKYGRVYDGSIKGEEIDVYCKGYKGRKAGTSIASAYAAGFAAKIISEDPDSNVTCLMAVRQEIKNILRQKTD